MVNQTNIFWRVIEMPKVETVERVSCDKCGTLYSNKSQALGCERFGAIVEKLVTFKENTLYLRPNGEIYAFGKIEASPNKPCESRVIIKDLCSNNYYGPTSFSLDFLEGFRKISVTDAVVLYRWTDGINLPKDLPEMRQEFYEAVLTLDKKEILRRMGIKEEDFIIKK
jgi:hypothetical protein